MDSGEWQRYFEGNRQRERLRCGPIGETELPGELRAALVHAIAVFQLGEAAGGRLARRIYDYDDSVLDQATRRSIELYVLEEGRHSAELASILRALGGKPLTKQWSNALFSRCRRALGLRTKLMTMAAAEIVGIAFYGMIHDRVPSPSLARVMAVIAKEESRHLDFQADLFARVTRITAAPIRAPYAALLGVEFSLILGAAIATVLVDQRRLFGVLGCRPSEFTRACMHEVSLRRSHFGIEQGLRLDYAR